MQNRFDELAKALAQSVTRRRALKRFGLSPAPTALALLRSEATAEQACFGRAKKTLARRIAKSLTVGWLCVLFCTPSAPAAERQILSNHAPAIVKRLNLQPAARLPSTKQLQLAIGLPLRNPQALATLLTQLYDPASPQYRHYLTPEQFTESFGAAEQDYEAVIAFAEAHNLRVTGRHPNRLLLDVSGSVADIERTFQVALHVYPHPSEAREFYAPDVEPSLELSVPVLSVSGLDNYALPRPRLVRAAPIEEPGQPGPLLGSGPSGTYMGKDFRQAYASNVSLTGAGQVLGLLEFDGFYAKDITTYESLAGLSKVRLKTVLLDGFKGTPGGGNIEVALDIEMAISMAPGLSQVLVYEAGPTGNWHDILNRMATDNLARQLSCSWYSPGAGPDPVADQIFQQMAAQGQSFYNASGDFDAYTGLISFPGDNPYITQVGGTTLFMTPNGGGYAAETVWNWNNGYGSGGGISTSYPLPSWQRGINLGASHGSGAWRNIPDVALTADNVFVVGNNGQQLDVGGTSCAAPLWAGFTALVNQQALAGNKPTVGFVNPAVYGLGASPPYPVAFHDITVGNNTNANSPNAFFAVPGYDLCTGWGSPNGRELLTALARTDSLSITGATGFSSGGPAGGPFSVSTQNFGLADQGSASLAWQAGSNVSWLSVTPTSGVLATGQPPAVVTVSLNETASTLPAGFYPGVVWFTNLTSGFMQGRQFVLAIAQGSYGGTVLSLNPSAYWQLNETAPVPPADVVNNAGSLGAIANGFGLAGPLQGDPGIVGQCFHFSNSNLDVGLFGAHVDVPHNPALNPAGAFTVELWAKPALAVTDFFCPAASVDDSSNGGLSRFGWVFYQTPGAWEFRVGSLGGYVAVQDGGLPAVGAWNHLVGVYDGADISLYVNGQLAGGPTNAGGFSPNTNITVPLRIGATTFPNRTFDGWVDEVALYAGALGADRIAAHYNTALVNPAGYATQVLADHPAGYWPLDEPAYPAPGPLPVAVNVGSLGANANGTYEPGSLPGVAGVPSPAFGLNNTACQLNGSGYADLAGWALNFTGPVSLVLWTKAPPANGYLQSIASRGAGSYRFLLDGTGQPHFADGTQPFGDLVGPTRIDDGAWHQLAGVYDGIATESLYVDGQLAAQSASATAPVPGNADDLSVGGDPEVGLFELFNGVVDEVCLFNYALTAAQVGQLHSVGTLAMAAQPISEVVQPALGIMRLKWKALPGRAYQLQYAVTLEHPNWVNLGAPITATIDGLSASDVITGSQRFYRAVLLP